VSDQGTATSGDRDLANKAMTAIDQVVDTLHDKVIRPILLAGRTLAFSLVLVVAALVIAVALCVALLRFLDVYAFAAHQWVSWAVLGAIFVTAGAAIWRLRRPATAKSRASS
jgi:hypothetical protein